MNDTKTIVRNRNQKRREMIHASKCLLGNNTTREVGAVIVFVLLLDADDVG